MRAILIDPFVPSITEVEIEDWKGIYPLTQCDIFTALHDNGNVLYIDDNGLYVDNQKFFRMPSMYPTPLAGRGLLLRYDGEGDMAPTEFSISDVEKLVYF